MSSDINITSNRIEVKKTIAKVFYYGTRYLDTKELAFSVYSKTEDKAEYMRNHVAYLAKNKLELHEKEKFYINLYTLSLIYHDPKIKPIVRELVLLVDKLTFENINFLNDIETAKKHLNSIYSKSLN